jgi:hypothetical protein
MSQKTKKRWVSAEEAVKLMDISVHAETLRRNKRSGWFKEGVHYKFISLPSVASPRAVFCVEAVEAFYALPLAKRKRYTTPAEDAA